MKNLNHHFPAICAKLWPYRPAKLNWSDEMMVTAVRFEQISAEIAALRNKISDLDIRSHGE